MTFTLHGWHLLVVLTVLAFFPAVVCAIRREEDEAGGCALIALLTVLVFWFGVLLARLL